MISKNDCYLLLADLQTKGIDTSAEINTLIESNDVPLSVLKFINDNRQLDLYNFYTQLRKNYNKKRSTLYINIMKEVEEPNTMLTTLSAMLTQILLYSKKADNKQLFLKHARVDDICKVLALYFKTYDLTNCAKLLRLIKVDIKAIESIA